MKSEAEHLRKKIIQKKARICILGLGYVGLPLAMRFAEAGFSVLGIDPDEDKVKSISKGVSYLEGVSSEALRSHPLQASTDSSLLKEADAAVI